MQKTDHTALAIRTCASCHFHQTNIAADKSITIVCRKNPPGVASQLVPLQGGPQWFTNILWPIVSKDDWCGAYERERVNGGFPNERIDGEISERAS